MPHIVGRLGRPVGLKGFIGLYVEPENLVHFRDGGTVAVGDDTFTIASLRRGKKGHEVRFAEILSREEAERLRSLDVTVSERRALEAGEFWPEQLRGLSVRPGGGEVVEVINGPAQDRLVIQRGALRFEVPFVEALVPVVDVEDGFVEIVEIEGLTDQASEH